MTVRKIATLKAARAIVRPVVTGNVSEVPCEITLWYGDGSRLEAKGILGKYDLDAIARFALQGLERIKAQELDRANSTQAMLNRLRGGQL